MDEFLGRFKARMKIFGNAEDEYLLKDILEPSFKDIKSLVGDFNPDSYPPGLELIFERGRYAYNDSLEYFYDNFQQRIMDVSFDLAKGRDSDGD